MAASVDLESAFDIDLNDWNLANGLDALQLSPARAVKDTLRMLARLDEFVVLRHSLEVGNRDEGEVLLALLVVFAHGTSRDAPLPIEDVSVLLEHAVDQSAFADAGRADEDQRLVLLRGRVERMEILLGVHEDVIGLREEDRGEEVVEDLADLQMLRNVLVVLLHQLVFARREVSQDLVVKIHIRVHLDDSSW